MLVRMSEEDPDYEGKWPEGDAMSERVLVPREPTPEMIRAGWPTAAPDWVVEALYRAMLDAAPAAPQMTDEEMDDAVKRDEAEQERAHIAYLRGIDEGKRQAAAPQQAEPVAQIGWADEFGNLFPMGAWKPTQRTHHDSHKTAWRPVFLHPPAAEVQQSQPAGHAQRSAPGKIWMNLGNDGMDEIEYPTWDALVRADENITWSEDRIDATDIPYVRADLAHPPAAEVQELRTAALALLNELDAGRHGAHEFNNLRNALRGE